MVTSEFINHLALWLALQGLLIGSSASIQNGIAGSEVLSLRFSLLPPVRKYYLK